MKKIFNNEIAMVFKNGRFCDVVESGKYIEAFGKEYVSQNKNGEISSSEVSAEEILNNKKLNGKVVTCLVNTNETVIHYVNNVYEGVYTKEGLHAFWANAGKHEFKTVSSDIVLLDTAEFSRDTLSKMPVVFSRCISEGFKGLVFVDGKFNRLLDAGTYFFLDVNNNINVDVVNTSLQTINIQPQEILTLDKVSIRFNVTAEYEFYDVVKANTLINDYKTVFYNRIQIALRTLVGDMKLDDLLTSKEEVSQRLLNMVKEEAEELYLNVRNVAIKDIILPGEIRNIMNTVLVAEKKAQAANITRREEVASTRSLLNTAKLMDENKTLYHLKELEYIERICANANSLNVGSGNILGELSKMIGDKWEF